MVRVGMGEDYGIDTADSLLPEKRSYNILAHIKGIVKETAAVDKQSLPSRKSDEGCAALADVYGG
jgi:hypothetical protein